VFYYCFINIDFIKKKSKKGRLYLIVKKSKCVEKMDLIKMNGESDLDVWGKDKKKPPAGSRRPGRILGELL
jgi:hypothetical protein